MGGGWIWFGGCSHELWFTDQHHTVRGIAGAGVDHRLNGKQDAILMVVRFNHVSIRRRASTGEAVVKVLATMHGGGAARPARRVHRAGRWMARERKQGQPS